jgi:excisionase family DNA binding protein
MKMLYNAACYDRSDKNDKQTEMRVMVRRKTAGVSAQENENKEQQKEQQREARLRELEEILGVRLLSVDVVKDKLRIHRQTLIKDIRTGKLPAYNTGRWYLIREDDVWNYLNQSRITPHEAPQTPPTPLVPPQQPTHFEEVVFLSIEDIMLFMHRGRPLIMQDVVEGKLTVYQPGKNMLVPREEVLRYLETFKVVPDLKEDEEGEE